MNNIEPLATRLRPSNLSEFIGQGHLLSAGKPLRVALEKRQHHSFILWGPPGVGKTTLAKLFAHGLGTKFVSISAVLSGVKEIRSVVETAKNNQKRTILFVDEIHRFNKAQQDAFLPYIEEGVITLMGATTENPSFTLNNALLSRARVYVLKSLGLDDLKGILARALTVLQSDLDMPIQFPDELQNMLVAAADGDARCLLNLLETLVDFSEDFDDKRLITQPMMQSVLAQKFRRFDRGQDIFHEQISALHDSVRGSNPDAALYWFCRMIDGGCDPLYIARRVIRMACEDVGNADPRAITLALTAAETYERLGSPEGELVIAQAIIYIACAAKSNAVFTAWEKAVDFVKSTGTAPVPVHLRNAPTKLLRSMGYGKGYRDPHDEPYAYAAGETYFPEEIGTPKFYEPTERGLEQKIREKLRFLKELDEQARVS
ncbi:MAG: replication-associated recombination protein A [Gammaproteobacteria bacterium]|nr:replication-associated recombination protein A [Gammaproteobacteria bacterium]